MDWVYQGREINEDDLDSKKAFVYRITNLIDKREYIGKKKLTTYSRKKIKGRKNRKKIIKESDWRSYYGSSQELLSDLEKHGEKNFFREVLRFCDSTSEATYYEMFLQVTENVLFYPEKYYNSIIQVRIHRSHVIKSNTLVYNKC